ncbi:hypothetical protein [Lysinibacillus fusiformis]|uniref:hypothetical protein n=1 Tax=Lysinibacillus fusiformis TaxID=28031 RepID=UPI0021C1DA06|nr:hypothetical protein [Lysinibacillus fusiformis]UXJ71371.1 hypothetical protein N5069_23395 [Lysinibacillus fusiformis]
MENKLIKEEISEQFYLYKNKLGIPKEITLSFKGIGDSGMYTMFNSIIIDNITVKQWTTNPHRTKFVIIHELVHGKFKELKNPFYIAFPFLIPPAVSLKYAMRELRANTIAHEKLDCSHEVLEDYFTNYCKIKDTSTNLALGYVSGITYINLINSNPIWNKQAIEDAIVYFTSEIPKLNKISQQKIEKVKSTFIQQL